MKFTPSLAGSMSGSMGGCTASHNKGGPYFRRRAVPTDPLTSFQSVVRDSFGSLSQVWVNTLTAAQRLAWDAYAQQVSWTDVLGQTIQLSGINHYVRANSVRLQNNFFQASFGSFAATARIDAAPTINDLGSQFIGDTPLLTIAAGPVVTLTIDNNTPGTAGTDVMFVYVSPPLNPSIRYYKGPLILAGSLAGNAAQVDIELSDVGNTPYTTRYPLPVAGQKVFVAVRMQKADGRLAGQAWFDVIATAV